MLNSRGISATFYNAGLEDAVRDERQKLWQADKVRVMVATNAFGMGIDKPDVRLVVHVDSPDSIEAYFQEAGRAGRDGGRSYAVLLYDGNDGAKLKRRISDTFPEKDFIRTVYEHLAYFYQIGMGSGGGCRFEFNIDKFCMYFKHFPVQVNSALAILSRAGYIEYEDERDNMAQLRMLLGREDLYRLDSLVDNESNVVTALLRNYGGLFTDYCYIDESLIAMQTGLEREAVYAILKDMSERRILHFIPRKKIPHIRYTQRREEMERLVFPHEVYDDRKAERSTDCGQCDVCRAHGGKATSKDALAAAQQEILNLLADGKPHSAGELARCKADKDVCKEAVEYLMAEEKIRCRDGMLYL